MKESLKKLFAPINEVEKTTCASLIFLLLYGHFLARVNLEYFDAIYTLRNGFICSLEQLSILITLLICLYRLFKGIKVKGNWFVINTTLMSAVFVFGLGDKLRWGQYIFNRQIPTFFLQNNSQGQITFHNLIYNGISINKVIFGSGLAIVVVTYLLIIPSLYHSREKFRAWIDTLGLPIPQPHQVAIYILAAIVALTIPAHKRGELVQLVGTWMFLMIFSYPKNRHAFI